VYLWYNLLSDYPGQSADERIINFRGEASSGWGGWETQSKNEVEESFIFSCPNHPEARRKSLAGLEALLRAYPFDGVFLDKIRFPSPAGGFEMMLSCFCPYCRQKARSQGLDLERVQAELEDWVASHPQDGNSPVISSSLWLDDLLSGHPLLKQFFLLRCRSIPWLGMCANWQTGWVGK
jgi:hypothetical protein